MDKSFNDEELSDIMKEIEALEEDFQSEGAKPEASSSSSEALDVSPELMEELAALDEDDAVPRPKSRPAPAPAPAPVAVAPHVEKEVEKVVPMAHHSKSKSSAKTSMSFKVSGELNLALEFDVGGKIVSLDVNESGLHIQMEGGMTFTVPYKKSA